MTDIVSATRDASWLVVGWFTPNYRHWAERLARSLDKTNAPYHLFAKDGSPEGWMANTRRKPLIASEAISRFPNKTIVLTDVDAEATGDIAVDFGGVDGRQHNRLGLLLDHAFVR